MSKDPKRPHSAGASLVSPFANLEAPVTATPFRNVRRCSSSDGIPSPTSQTPPKLQFTSKSWVAPTSGSENWRAYDPNLFDIMSVAPKVLAKQMAIVDHSYFQRITREEFTSLDWTGSDPKNNSPSVFQTIKRFNNLTLWFANQILASSSVKRRSEKIDHFIEIAKYCADYHNYNGLKCILASLQSAPIYRLSKTWDIVEKKKIFESLSTMMSSDNNYEKYRKKLASAKNEPCVPYLGQCLTDIVFHNEMKNKNKSDGQKNLDNYIEDLVKMQQSGYDFQNLPEAIEFLSSDFFISEFERQYEDENYNQSLRLEPKEAGESPLRMRHTSSSKSITDSNEKIGRPLSGNYNNVVKCLICETESEGDSSDSEEQGTTLRRPHSDDVLNESTPLKKAELYVKCLMTDFKKAKNRQWKKYLVVLRQRGLMFYKSYNTQTLETRESPFMTLDVCVETFAGVALEYKKRKHVFRLSPAKGYEYFVECHSDDDMSNWIEHITSCVQNVS